MSLSIHVKANQAVMFDFNLSCVYIDFTDGQPST